MLQTKNPF